MNIRVGMGYDVHRFTDDRPLVLGGVTIPYSRGLLGHSDADVLLHSVCDALLGALALGDLGKHFPDSSDEFKGIDSKLLLKRSYKLVKQEGFFLVNLDSVLILEKPRMKDFIPQIRKTIAEIMETGISSISVKATTTERLGFTGREEGIAAQSVVLLAKRDISD